MELIGGYRRGFEGATWLMGNKNLCKKISWFLEFFFSFLSSRKIDFPTYFHWVLLLDRMKQASVYPFYGNDLLQ